MSISLIHHDNYSHYFDYRIESSGSEISDDIMRNAVDFAHSRIQPIIRSQLAIVSTKKNRRFALPEISSSSLQSTMDATNSSDVSIWRRDDITVEIYKPPADLLAYAKELGYDAALAVFANSSITRPEQAKLEGRARYEILNGLKAHDVYKNFNSVTLSMAAEDVMTSAFRDTILVGKSRVDGRGLDEVRPLAAHADVLPSVHGSSFFQRGDTHVLGTVTLGARKDAKQVEAIDGTGLQPKYFFLHYDFPPYCTGEVGNSTAINRRMIGHGRLAEKAIAPVIPSQSDFPYSVRVFTECTSSSGSSSMASACAASLSLLDAGVPISSPVAGVSIGIVADPLDDTSRLTVGADGSKYTLLTDIMGMEDHYGDMDFKIAGTKTGITAMQLDVKIADGVPVRAVKEALDRARQARLHILETMNKARAVPRTHLKPQSPLAVEIKYDPDRKRHLIGPGGEMIRFIEKTYECEIDTEQDGIAHVFGYSHAGVTEAELLVRDLLIEPQEGDVHVAQVQLAQSLAIICDNTLYERLQIVLFSI
jgi:polyribonucleotide nucleotidyltransferase